MTWAWQQVDLGSCERVADALRSSVMNLRGTLLQPNWANRPWGDGRCLRRPLWPARLGSGVDCHGMPCSASLHMRLCSMQMRLRACLWGSYFFLKGCGRVCLRQEGGRRGARCQVRGKTEGHCAAAPPSDGSIASDQHISTARGKMKNSRMPVPATRCPTDVATDGWAVGC